VTCTYKIYYCRHNILLFYICQTDNAAPVDVVVEQAASSTPIETRLAADGVGYTWAEFESYFDASLAAEFWEADQVVAAPEPTPELSFFRPGLPSFESLHDFQCAPHSRDADDPCAGPTISLAQGKRITQATGMVWPN